MSTPSTDGLKLEIDAGRMRIGNEIQLASGLPAFTGVTQLTADASSKLQGTSYSQIVQPTNTLQMFDLTGNSATGILTNTLVGAASVTTATIGGYIRVAITTVGSGLTTGNYYLPIYTIV